MIRRWEKFLLYAMFIGCKDHRGNSILDSTFYEVTGVVEENIYENLEGYTEIKLICGVGKTKVWGDEDTILMLILTEDADIADSTLENQGVLLAEELEQDQVWIMKQDVQRLIAQRQS